MKPWEHNHYFRLDAAGEPDDHEIWTLCLGGCE
jgi:hypothetical protein